MEVVENIVEVSAKLESIHQFCKFSEDIHKTAKCHEKNCKIGTYISSLMVVFDPELDYNFRINFFIKKKIQLSIIKFLNLCFNYRTLVKKE